MSVCFCHSWVVFISPIPPYVEMKSITDPDLFFIKIIQLLIVFICAYCCSPVFEKIVSKRFPSFVPYVASLIDIEPNCWHFSIPQKILARCFQTSSQMFCKFFCSLFARLFLLDYFCKTIFARPFLQDYFCKTIPSAGSQCHMSRCDRYEMHKRS